ncbi:MAG: hypothetical protein SGJ19_27595 [Planctomycetia bacterium]|nr:hypothetical protein [Planctomycetia bacterium]
MKESILNIRLLILGFIATAAWAMPVFAQSETSDDPLDAELLEGLAPEPTLEQTAGEDLGAVEDPLLRLAEQMRTVGDWLRAAQLGSPTQTAQEEIIINLDQMIAQQQKQCQGSGQKPSGSNQSRAARKPGSSQKPGEAGAQAAADSTDKMRPGENAKPEMANPQDLLKKVWGHLPERLRDRMLQNPAERFLPKYEREIEAYFERLAETDESE